MLKITAQKVESGTRLALEGRLAGPWVEELERCWREAGASAKGDVVVDLSGVTFIEQTGKVLLKRMWQEGVKLLAAGCCTRSIVDEIRRQK
ncbi:MAG TPA: hypothetical protein VJ746_01035 [Nitrospira sp.]|nr:hypothetical protein [Nitrospira sp.]